MAIEGFSCTAFCYGQTGSGKTHTLTGPPDLVWNTQIIRFIQLFRHLVSLHVSLLVRCRRRYIQIFVFRNSIIWLQFIGKPQPTDSRHGLVFRAFLYLFQLLQERKDTNFVLKASFLEIYNEKVSATPFHWFNSIFVCFFFFFACFFLFCFIFLLKSSLNSIPCHSVRYKFNSPSPWPNERQP